MFSSHIPLSASKLASNFGYYNPRFLCTFFSTRCNGKKSLDRSEEKLNEKKLDTVPEESNGDT